MKLLNGIKRDEFPILSQKKYFNTCSISALSKSVKQALSSFLEQWDVYGGVSWVMEDGWNNAVELARDQFAKLIGAKTDNVAFSFGNSVSMASITSAFHFKDRDEVIFNAEDFPSSPTHLMALAEKGVKYKVVPSRGRFVDPLDYASMISEKTKLISSCEVISNTGYRIDKKQLSEISNEKSIPLILDVYQSIGYIPLNVSKLDIDFVISGSLKWLLGGFGISFLYIRDDWIEKLNPSSIGWYGVADNFQDLLDKLRTKLHRPKTAEKFQYGTPYPFGAIGAKEGMKIVNEIGDNRIYQQNMQLTQLIIDGLDDIGLKTLTPRQKEHRGSIVNIQIPNAAKIAERLKEKDFILDMRSNGIRVSPHFYNNSSDIEILLEELKKLRDK